MSQEYDLPADTWRQIFCLIGIETAIRCTRVSKRWFQLASHDVVWRTYYLQKWKIIPAEVKDPGFSWKAFFMKRYKCWNPHRSERSVTSVGTYKGGSLRFIAVAINAHVIALLREDGKVFFLSSTTYEQLDTSYSVFSYHGSQITFLLHDSLDAPYLIYQRGPPFLLLDYTKQRTLDAMTFGTALVVKLFGSKLVALTPDALCIWDLNTIVTAADLKKPIQTIGMKKYHVKDCDVHVDTNIVAVQLPRALHVWNMNTAEFLYTIKQSTVFRVVMNEELIGMVSAAECQLYEKKTGVNVSTVSLYHVRFTPITSCWMDEDMLVVHAGSNDRGIISVYSPRTQQLLHKTERQYGAIVLAWNESIVVTTSGPWRDTMSIHDIESGNLICNLQGHTSSISSARIWDSKILSIGADNCLMIWTFDVPTEKFTEELAIQLQPVLKQYEDGLEVFSTIKKIQGFCITSELKLLGVVNTIFDRALKSSRFDLYADLLTKMSYNAIVFSRGIDVTCKQAAKSKDTVTSIPMIVSKRLSKEFENFDQSDLLAQFLKELCLKRVVEEDTVSSIMAVLIELSEKTEAFNGLLAILRQTSSTISYTLPRNECKALHGLLLTVHPPAWHASEFKKLIDQFRVDPLPPDVQEEETKSKSSWISKLFHKK